MNNGDSLEQQALASAKQYMGGVAWPTVCYALVVFFSYGLVLASALAGALSLWIATPMVITLTYLSYTVLHEAVHGTITGGQQSLRWINEALGYIAGWILMTPLLPANSATTAFGFSGPSTRRRVCVPRAGISTTSADKFENGRIRITNRKLTKICIAPLIHNFNTEKRISEFGNKGRSLSIRKGQPNGRPE